MTRRKSLTEINQIGRERGYRIASWISLPEIGSKLPKEIDWIGIDTITGIESAGEAFCALASDSECNERQFTPFESLAAELNSHPNPEAAWEQFTLGIDAGIAQNWAERKSNMQEK